MKSLLDMTDDEAQQAMAQAHQFNNRVIAITLLLLVIYITAIVIGL